MASAEQLQQKLFPTIQNIYRVHVLVEYGNLRIVVQLKHKDRTRSLSAHFIERTSPLRCWDTTEWVEFSYIVARTKFAYDI